MRVLALIFAIVVVAADGFAQELQVPRFDLGMGYSYARMHVPNKSDSANLNGIQFDLTYNVNRMVGITGEFTGHYKCLTGCFWDGSTSRYKAFTFVGGPRVNLRNKSRLTPWVHALAGVSNVSYSEDYGADVASTNWAIAAGGGLDFSFGNLAVRTVQVDLLRHDVGGRMQNDLRIGFGVTLGLGQLKKK